MSSRSGVYLIEGSMKLDSGDRAKKEVGSLFFAAKPPPGAVTGVLFFFAFKEETLAPRWIRLRGEASRGAAPNTCRAKGAAPPGLLS